jgi:hypothetical protein
MSISKRKQKENGQTSCNHKLWGACYPWDIRRRNKYRGTLVGQNNGKVTVQSLLKDQYREIGQRKNSWKRKKKKKGE